MNTSRWLRYPKLLWAFARYCLVREMMFRTNFLTRCLASMGWLVWMVVFFQMIFSNTERIGDWNRWEYLFFMGTGMILNGILDAFFVENCTNMSDLIRSGDLDHALAKPVDEQFLLTCRHVDWSEIGHLFLGIVLLFVSMANTGATISVQRALGYILLLGCGTAIFYSLLVMLASSSVWLVRNQALYEVWWYVVQFGRYPAEIYTQDAVLGLVLRFALTFVLPILLAINVPARFGTDGKFVPWELIAYLVIAATVFLWVSRWFFRTALHAYRSASS